MLKVSSKQLGSAHVVIIIVLIAAIVTALGYVVWNNFMNKSSEPQESSIQKSTQPAEERDDTSREENVKYDDNELSFEYPASGWEETETITSDERVRLASDDYVPNVGMGLESGASVAVMRTNQQEVNSSTPGVKNVKEIQIDGNKAFKYDVEYEGYRLNAFFSMNVETYEEKSYAIVMETAGPATDDERKVFELIINSLDIK